MASGETIRRSYECSPLLGIFLFVKNAVTGWRATDLFLNTSEPPDFQTFRRPWESSNQFSQSSVTKGGVWLKQVSHPLFTKVLSFGP